LPNQFFLPLKHYQDRYRKAYADLQIVGGNLQVLRQQKEEVKQRIRFFRDQADLLQTEFDTAELALRSAVLNHEDDEPQQANDSPMIKFANLQEFHESRELAKRAQQGPPDPNQDGS
jgi:hypothetical protein